MLEGAKLRDHAEWKRTAWLAANLMNASGRLKFPIRDLYDLAPWLRPGVISYGVRTSAPPPTLETFDG